MRRALLLAAAVLAAPASAPAATLQLEGDVLVVRSAPGAANRSSLAQPSPGVLRITDPFDAFAAEAGCTVVDPEYPEAADCPMPARVRVELGDRDDSVMLRESLPSIPVHVLGGAGDDGLAANADVDNHVVLDGGDGDDTLRGHGFADELHGGPGDDELEGGAGNDVLRAGEGDDALVPDAGVDVQGDDVVDGGPGFDSARDWGSTSTDPAMAVAITVGAGADDGRPGERDDVTGIERFDALWPGRYVLADGADSIDLPNFGTSVVEGRGGADRLTGNDGTETIDGGAGDDRVEGGFGHDVLTGGPGRDQLFGDETAQRCSYLSHCTVVPFGNDVIHARDGEADQVDCGVGEDRAVVDAEDVVAGCEVVERPGGAAPPRPGPQPPARATLTAARGLRTALRRGLVVRVAGAAPGRHRLVARSAGRVVASATAAVTGAGRATVRLRFTAAARKRLGRRRSVRLALSGAGAAATVTLR